MFTIIKVIIHSFHPFLYFLNCSFSLILRLPCFFFFIILFLNVLFSIIDIIKHQLIPLFIIFFRATIWLSLHWRFEVAWIGFLFFLNYSWIKVSVVSVISSHVVQTSTVPLNEFCGAEWKLVSFQKLTCKENRRPLSYIVVSVPIKFLYH